MPTDLQYAAAADKAPALQCTNQCILQEAAATWHTKVTEVPVGTSLKHVSLNTEAINQK
jgi:hypothetical protein